VNQPDTAEERYLRALAKMTVALEVFAGTVADVAHAAKEIEGDGGGPAAIAFERCQSAIARAARSAPEIMELFKTPATEQRRIILARG
jgi:hypothetical protein